MDYSELLHEFLDGEMDAAHEDTLFGALQRDENLRLEMKDMLEMRRAVEADKAAFLPTASSTNAIFSQLGFAAPVAGGAAGLAGAGAALGSSSASGTAAAASGLGLAQMLGVFLATTLLTSLVFFGLVIPQAQEDARSSKLATQQQQASESLLDSNPLAFTMELPADFSQPLSDAATNTSPKVANADFAGSSRKTASLKSQAAANALVESTSPSAGNIQNSNLPQSAAKRSLFSQAKTSEASQTHSRSTVSQSESRSADNTIVPTKNWLASSNTHSPVVLLGEESDERRAGPNKPEAVATSFATLDDISISSLPEFQFELRGNGAAKFFQNADVTSTGDPWFNEMSASMMLPIEEQFEFGVSFGQEVFSQVFFRREAGGRLIEYQQKPRLFWGGVTGRYYPLSASTAPIAPYAQLTLGFNFFGTVAKPAAGLRFTPDESRMSLFLAAEYSHLLYWEDRTMFNSGKLNLNYGVSYRL